MKQHIEAYLKAHESAWAPSTMKSERSRLTQLAPLLHLDPAEVFSRLQTKGMKPYTIKTAFIRVMNLERWARIQPRFAEYMRTHGRRFKHLYVKEEVKVTYEDAMARINNLEERARRHACSILCTGVRLSESYNIDDGQVVGKGGKTRKVFGQIEVTVPKSTLQKALKEVGLKPHTLRKLCATRLAENGATPADLCKIFGWSSISTAYQYLQAKDDTRLEALMAKSKEG